MNTGQGRIYKRGEKWWIQYGYRGADKRESTRSTRRKDAVNLLRKRLSEIGAGRLIGPDAEKVTLADLKAIAKTDYEVNGRRSLDRMLDAWAHVHAILGKDYRALDVTPDRLTGYVVERQAEGAALATIGQELAALRRGFRLAWRAGRLPPPPSFPTLHIANARQGFVDDADLESLLPHLPDYVQPLIRFLAFTGWRVREALGVQWSQVDFTASTVRLHTSKNGDARTFPFGSFPALAELLQEQRARTSALVAATGEPIPWVFHRHGAQLKDFRHVWREACQRAGFPGLLVHDLRRSAVRSLERAGVSRSVAMSLTGHRTEAIYKRYAIVDSAAQSEGVAKLAAFHRTVIGQSDGSADADRSGDAA